MNKQQEKTMLKPQYLRLLKKNAHHLNPIVQFGKKGLNEALLVEIKQALYDHELIKIRIAPDEKEVFKLALPLILESCEAHLVDTIGNVVILFKEKEKEKK